MQATIEAVYNLHGGKQLEIVQGDLTCETADAIVNAANSRLSHGGGVAAAIVRAGGVEIQRESDAWVRANGNVAHDRPAVTGAGRLSCRYVIHAVGPVWGTGQEDDRLASAILGSLKAAESLNLAVIAFPPIATGIFGFPRERAARIFFDTFRVYFQSHHASSLQTVRLTILDDETVNTFMKVFREWSQEYPDEENT